MLCVSIRHFHILVHLNCCYLNVFFSLSVFTRIERNEFVSTGRFKALLRAFPAVQPRSGLTQHPAPARGPSALAGGPAPRTRKPPGAGIRSPAQRPRPRPRCLGDERPLRWGEIMATSVGTVPGGMTTPAMTPGASSPESEVRRPFSVPATPGARGRGPSRGCAARPAWCASELTAEWGACPGRLMFEGQGLVYPFLLYLFSK